MITQTEKNTSKRIAMPHSLPPKPSQLTLRKKPYSGLQNSMINELTLLENSLPDQSISLTPQAQQYLQIRNSQSSQKERIDLSISSDCLDTQYQYGYLRKKVQDLTGKLAMLVQQQCSANRQIQFYKRKADDYLERNKQFEISVKQLTQKILHYEQKIQQQLQHIYQIETQNELQRKQFEVAKQIGQRQIDQLLQKLQANQKQVSALKSKIADQKTIGSQVSSNSIPTNKQQSSYMKRFYQFSRKIDARLSRSVGKEPLFGGVSARSCVGTTACDMVHHSIDKAQRIKQLEKQNHLLMNLIQQNSHITRSVHTRKITFF